MARCVAYENLNGKTQFVEDQDEWPHKWNKLEMVYDVIGTSRSISQKDLRKALNLAMTTWDIEINIKFIPKYMADGKPVDITVDFETSEQNDYFKDRPSVLAYAYYPGQGSVSGKVVFNDDYIWTLNGDPVRVKDAPPEVVKGTPDPDAMLKTHNVIHVLIHELGHSLGLKHDASGNKDGRDVMDAYYSGELELSDRDIYRIRLKYPPRIFSRWHLYARLKKAVARMKSRL